MRFAKRVLPYLILVFALLVFVFPVFGDRTLTNFSDTYVLYPWTQHRPDGWFASHTIDGTPIYLIHPSELLNRTLLNEGTFLSWNPYVGFGAPWLANMQPAQYFPLKIIAYMWPDFWKGADIVRLVLFFLAGSGNYLLLRSIGIGRNAAIFSGLSYMLCERLFLLVNMPSFQVECLLPMMLFAVNEMTKNRSVGFALFAGIIGGAQFLAGFPEGSFIFALVATAFFVFRVFFHSNARYSLTRTLGLGLITATLAVAMSSFQLIEFIRYTFYSDHVHVPGYGSITKPIYFLLSLLLPNFFGEPFQPPWTSEVAAADHFSYSMFCGISTVILSLIAIMSGRSAPYRAYFWFFFSLFIFFVGYDFGFPIITKVGDLPLFNLMSVTWNAFVIPFSLSVLAGFGFQYAFGFKVNFEPIPIRPIAVSIALYAIAILLLCTNFSSTYLASVISHVAPAIVVLPIFLVAIWLAHRPRFFNTAIVLMFVLVAGELLYSNSGLKYLHFYSPNAKDPPSLKWISENIGHERILGIDGVYPANRLMSYRIRDIRHIDAMFPTLYVDYVDAIWPGARGNVYTLNHSEWKKYDDPLLDLAGVRYIVSKIKLAESEFDPRHFAEVYRDDDVFIYRNDKALPRARFVTAAMKAPVKLSPQTLRSEISDSAERVVIEGIENSAQSDCPVTSKPELKYLADSPDQVRLHVSTPCHGFVVLSDLFYPGWKATLDGNESVIYRANYAFRAIEVSPGDHVITFSYRPWSIAFGVVLILLVACGFALRLIIILYRGTRLSFK